MSGIETFLAAYGSTIATAVAVVGTVASANAQANAAKYNAEVARQNADLATRNALMQEERHRAQVRKQLGDLRAGYASSGVQMEGSPLDVLASSVKNAELDSLIIRSQGATNAWGFSAESQLQRKRASSALTSGYLQAGTTAASGLAGSYSSSIQGTPVMTIGGG